MASPEPVREVHAARLKIQDETTGMSAAERTDYYQKKSANFFSKLGITPQYVNFAGQGRVLPSDTR
jgi:Zn/Cd-binding protein ZinT